MSTEQLEQFEELGRRAIACKRWRWMDGMLYKQDGVGVRPVIATAPIIQGGGLPDLTDPATLGCLLALVREAWGPTASVSVNLSGFWAVGGATVLKGKGKGASINLGIWKNSELEALVAALEVAP